MLLSGATDEVDQQATGPVHQWLTYQAWRLYDSQFVGSEIGSFIGD